MPRIKREAPKTTKSGVIRRYIKLPMPKKCKKRYARCVRAISRLKETLGLCGFLAVRRLERSISPSRIHSFFSPLAKARAAAGRVEAQPRYFRASSARALRQARVGYFLSRVLEFFPDRLAAEKWRNRFETIGLHHIAEARARGSRVVLVCFHFGTYKLIPFWLRALGIPVIAVIGGRSAERGRVKRMKDRLSPFPEMPTVLHLRDELRKSVEHLSSGHVLLMAADRAASKQVIVPIDDRWSFSMATGAMRLAAHCDAELIPCSMTDQGGWNFRLEIEPPIPREFLSAESNLHGAGQHLLEAMLPHLRRYPEACSDYLLDRFQLNVTTPAVAPICA